MLHQTASGFKMAHFWKDHSHYCEQIYSHLAFYSIARNSARACSRQRCCLERSNGRVRLERVRCFPHLLPPRLPYLKRLRTAVSRRLSVPGHRAQLHTSSDEVHNSPVSFPSVLGVRPRLLGRVY
ncbi:hypothetical protein NDU88_007374 [Pleurodeles waltl]|uniref:Uncharacterized protein n=1 Tax=Pleurodeles waltl TaxID=8319 RepID=A0AAV7U068_PLEWA|nr:hypothetical protein NDU88_007374 [Pleurodeles waltl]